MTTQLGEAIGYVRSIHHSTAWLDRADQEVRVHGSQMGFQVKQVFRDHVSSHEAANVAGFMAMLDELRVHGGKVVLVASPAQLSLVPEVRRWMARMIAHLGARVVVVETTARGVARVGGNAS